MSPETASKRSGRSATALEHLQIFGTFATSIAGTLGSNLLAALPFCWLLSTAAFFAVAAGLYFSAGSSSVLAAIPSSWMFVAYILVGIVCVTPLAAAIAVERSIDPIVHQLDRLATPLVAGIAAEIQLEAPRSVADLSARLDQVVIEFRRHAGRMISPLSPGGIVARLVTRLILRDVRRSLAGQIIASLQAQPGAERSIESIAPLVRSQITAAIGDDLRRKATIGRIVSVVIWIVVFALSTLPIVLLT